MLNEGEEKVRQSSAVEIFRHATTTLASFTASLTLSPQAAVMSERIVQLLQATPLRDASPTVLIASALVVLPVLAVLLNVAAQLVSRRVLVSAVTESLLTWLPALLTDPSW